MSELPPSPPRSTCARCGEPIVWAEAVNGLMMPLDAEPVLHGHVAVAVEFGMWRAFPRRDEWPPGAPRYTSHLARCEMAPRRKKKPPKQGIGGRRK